LNENRIAYEMDSNSTRDNTFIEMSRNSLGDLLLQVPKVLSLSSNASTRRVVPRSHQPTRILITLYLESDFFHRSIQFQTMPTDSVA
jgi:hypothetical protein